MRALKLFCDKIYTWEDCNSKLKILDPQVICNVLFD